MLHLSMRLATSPLVELFGAADSRCSRPFTRLEVAYRLIVDAASTVLIIQTSV